MKIKAFFLALFVAGLAASMALASPPPWAGGGKGKAKHDPAAAATTTGSTATGTTTTSGSHKVLICHRTGSKKHPYVLISVSSHSAHARGKHKGDLPASGGSCPKAPAGTTSTATTTTGTTTTGTTTTGTTATTTTG